MRNRIHRQGRSLIAALVLLGAAHVALPDRAGATELPTNAPAPVEQPADDPTADDDTPRWPLIEDADAQPESLTLGDPFVVTIDLGRSITGFDGVLRYDPEAIEFAGATPVSSDSTVFSNDEEPGRVALTIVSEPQDLDQRAVVEVRLLTTSPGLVEVAFDVFTTVDAAGESADSTLTLRRRVTVTEPDDPQPVEALDAPPPVRPDDAAPAPGAPGDPDVNDDGVVDTRDLVEVKIGWDEQTASDVTCVADADQGDATDRFEALDVDRDGCLGVEDFAAVNAATTATSATASVPPPAAPAGVTAFVVDTVSDEHDNQLNDDLCITPSGGCSLRAAILQANATAGPNRIEFAIPGSGPHTIVLGDKLPTISDVTGWLEIDGYTQPGASPNGDPLVSDADIRIGITSSAYVDGRPAFAITSSGNTIRGVAVYNTYWPFLVSGALATGNQILGNYIGTDPGATYYKPNPGFTNAAGIQLDIGAAHNVVGTPDLADRNVIAGNRSWGMRIEQNDTDHNVVQNNLFGLHPSGTARLSQHGGIDVQYGAEHTLIGGRAAHEHNVLSGHVYGAIDFSHNTFNNRAIGNYLGTDVTGRQAFSWTRNDYGFMIKDDARLNTYLDNVIANSDFDGIYNKHNYSGANTFIGNWIGIGLDGVEMGNRRHGFLLRGHDDLFQHNTVAHNTQDGVYLDSNNDSGANDDETTLRNRLTENRFWSNGSMAIDIRPHGQNPNDPGDGDTGTQELLNHPEITTATTGSISGTACAGCEVEVYQADAASNRGQGRQHLGTVVAAGDGSFVFADGRIVAGQVVTALAIDLEGNTSEFAPKVNPDGAPDPGGTPPVLTSPGDLVFLPDTPAMVTLTATPAGATFAALRLPDGLTLDPLTGEVSGTPTRAGVFPVTLSAINPVGADYLDVTWTVELGQVPPVVDPIPDQFGTAGASVSVPVIASDANDDVLTYSATGLPPGLDIDPVTGLISGTLGGSGDYPVTVTVTDGFTPVDTSFTWTVDPGFVCSIEGTTLSWTDQGTGTYYIRHIQGGENVYLGSVTGALTYEIPSPYGTYEVVTYTPERITTQCDGPGGELPTFECSITGTTLTWTDQGTGTYYIRHLIDGEDRYLTAVSDGLSYEIPSPYGTYVVVTYTPERITTQCDAPGGQGPPAFECSVSGTTLSWTDQSVGTYYVRQQVSGADLYIGSSTGLSMTVPDPYGTFEVRIWDGVLKTTTCDGVVLPEFSCQATAGLLTWSDQAALVYHLRHVEGLEDVYLGSTTGLSLPVTQTSGEFHVIFYRSGHRFVTTCPA